MYQKSWKALDKCFRRHTMITRLGSDQFGSRTQGEFCRWPPLHTRLGINNRSGYVIETGSHWHSGGVFLLYIGTISAAPRFPGWNLSPISPGSLISSHYKIPPIPSTSLASASITTIMSPEQFTLRWGILGNPLLRSACLAF